MFTVWSATHIIQGAAYAVVCARLFHLSFLWSVVVILVFHTMYEYKDYHLTYVVYGNDASRIDESRRRASHFGPFIDLVHPPNSLINSAGDTLCCAIGVAVGYGLVRYISFGTARVIAALAVFHILFFVALHIVFYQEGLLTPMATDTFNHF